METLHDYLDTIFQGRDTVSDAEIQSVKHTYWKQYWRIYRTKRSQTHARIQASVPIAQKKAYSAFAELQGMKLSELIQVSLKACITTGDMSPNRQVCLLSKRLRDMIEDYQYEYGAEELTEALELTDKLIDTSCDS